MNNTSKIHRYKNLTTLARRLRSDAQRLPMFLLYAFNRTGKTRLSMAFKDRERRKERQGTPDTLYFNAYTEDLFSGTTILLRTTGSAPEDQRKRLASPRALLELDWTKPSRTTYHRYADFEFDIDYGTWEVTFRKGDDERIKTTRARWTAHQDSSGACSSGDLPGERVIDGVIRRISGLSTSVHR